MRVLRKGLLESTERFYRVYAINFGWARGEASEDAPRDRPRWDSFPGERLELLRAGLNPAGEGYSCTGTRLLTMPQEHQEGNEADPGGAPILGYYIQGSASRQRYRYPAVALTHRHPRFR